MADRRRSFTPWLMAFLILVPLAVAVLLVAVFPMADCPQQSHEDRKANPDVIHGGWGRYRCHRCKDSGRITILNRWLDGKESHAYWEGMEISTITASGFVKTNQQAALDAVGMRPGIRMTHRLQVQAILHLWKTESYESVHVDVKFALVKPGKVDVFLDVRER